MAKDEEKPTAAEKGKGKVNDVSELNGDSKKGKAAEKGGKPDADGKVVDAAGDGESSACGATLYSANSIPDNLSEEDRQLKEELEMLVERLQVEIRPYYNHCHC